MIRKPEDLPRRRFQERVFRGEDTVFVAGLPGRPVFYRALARRWETGWRGGGLGLIFAAGSL